jgi:hypothetical protein
MNRSMLYVTGPPAVGKSTVVSSILAHSSCISPAVERVGPLTVTRFGPVSALGDYSPGRGEFVGTDALPMSILPAALRVLCAPEISGRWLGEGDRLASAGFFDALRRSGWYLVHVALVPGADYADRLRCRQRAGWSPSPSWLKGRITKSARLADSADLRVDSSGAPAAVASQVLKVLPW